MVQLGEYRIQVVCLKNAYQTQGNWRGTWIMRAVTSDDRPDYTLVTARTALEGSEKVEPRSFKTFAGVVGFLHETGCISADVPLYKGMSIVQRSLGPNDLTKDDKST
ncbi:hypothetical protein D8780_15495 [Notoacmeibacter ruber]|uniref:Uncharacterized protein n=1 Tax=Notoacmeibacter ruber TaxID=2670375 RepID=A0A3L7J370_9HYPH|nr:hypothetical protein D8780_15495 [Notoacmeibacter ruber]